MKSLSIFFLFILNLNLTFSQETVLSLDTCLKLARINFPQIKQLDLVKDIESLNIKNLNSSWLPSLNGTAQASYQSDVTAIQLSIPGFPTIVPPNKDQYRFSIDANQLIYDGGTFKKQKRITHTISQIESLKVEGEFYKIKEKVIQLYFGILILHEQIKILKLSQNDLESQLIKTKSAYEANIVSGYQYNSVQAEKLKLEQRNTELESQQNILISNLSFIILIAIRPETKFIIPSITSKNVDLERPEYKLLKIQGTLIDQQNQLNNLKFVPKIGSFAQGGYANPALNFLKNKFELFYITGLKLNWNISSIYNLSRDKKISVLNKNIFQLQEESFKYKINLEKSQYEEDLRKFETLIQTDQSLVKLRTKIKEASKLQYDNGISTVSDYLRDVNAEEQARTNEAIHKLSFLQSIYLNNNLFGN